MFLIVVDFVVIIVNIVPVFVVIELFLLVLTVLKNVVQFLAICRDPLCIVT
jgi:hypothetical protein